MTVLHLITLSAFSFADRADADRRGPRLHRLLGAAVDLQSAPGTFWTYFGTGLN